MFKLALKNVKKLAQLQVWLAALIAAGLIAYGVYGLRKAYVASHSPNPIAGILSTATDPKAVPDETPIDTKQSYTVPADQPRLLSLPSIGVEGFVQRIDTDPSGVLAVPANVHVAGWYVGSVKPGEPGLSIIDGHLQGTYREGIFKHLTDVRVGDPIEVSLGDGSIKRFEVTSVTTYSLAEAGKALYAKDPAIASELNLITCGGDYDSSTKTYNERVVVVAKLEV